MTSGQPPKLQRINRASVKDQALEQLKSYIMSGTLLPGQRLPSERDLAEQLGVGRNSVREALKVLEAVGLVESRIGEGTFLTTNMGTSIGRTIGFSLAVWGGAIVEIHDARLMIEVGAAYAAAERAEQPDLEALAAELQRMENSVERSPEYLEADLNFHRLVGQATHNEIVSRIITDLIDLLEEMLSQVDTTQLMTTAEGTSTHRTLFEAIAQHNPTLAAENMRNHLQFATEFWQAVTSLGSARSGLTNLE